MTRTDFVPIKKKRQVFNPSGTLPPINTFKTQLNDSLQNFLEENVYIKVAQGSSLGELWASKKKKKESGPGVGKWRC